MSGSSRTKRPAYQFTLIGLFGVITVLAVALGVVLTTVRRARLEANRDEFQMRLRFTSLALNQYADVHRQLPTGTTINAALKPDRRLSWMVQVTPFMRAGLYPLFDHSRAWDAPVNRQGASTPVDFLLNPQLGGPATVGGYAATHYVGIAGVGKDAATLPKGHPRAGLFGNERMLTLEEVAAADGTSGTMAIVEISKNIGPWAAGGPSTLRGLTARPYINGPDGFGGAFPGGMHVVFADTACRFISNKVDPKVLEAAATTHGGESQTPF